MYLKCGVENIIFLKNSVSFFLHFFFRWLGSISCDYIVGGFTSTYTIVSPLMFVNFTLMHVEVYLIWLYGIHFVTNFRTLVVFNDCWRQISFMYGTLNPKIQIFSKYGTISKGKCPLSLPFTDFSIRILST